MTLPEQTITPITTKKGVTTFRNVLPLETHKILKTDDPGVQPMSFPASTWICTFVSFIAAHPSLFFFIYIKLAFNITWTHS